MLALLLAATGCIVHETTGPAAPHSFATVIVRPVEAAVQDATAVVLASLAYRDLNARWPADLAELRTFCAAHPGTGEGIRWEQLSAATFTPRPDGGLRVECTVDPERPETPAASVVVEMNPDGGLRRP